MEVWCRWGRNFNNVPNMTLTRPTKNKSCSSRTWAKWQWSFSWVTAASLLIATPPGLAHFTSWQRLLPRCQIPKLPPTLDTKPRAGSTSLISPYIICTSPRLFKITPYSTPFTDSVLFYFVFPCCSKLNVLPFISFLSFWYIPHGLWLVYQNPCESPEGGRRATFAGSRGICSYIWPVLLQPSNGSPGRPDLPSWHPVVAIAALFL